MTAEPCPPRAQLGGDSAAIERVAGELRELGVSIAPATAGCPSVQAVVELDRGGGIAVAVHGASHGSEGRVMSDAALAAAWIDSWARDDLEVASWGVPATRPIAPPVIAPRDVPPATSTVEPPPLLARLAISGSYEQSWTADGSAWRGGSASGCVVVGRFCLGARVRAAFEPPLTAGATAAARSDLSAFAIGSLPFTVGQMTIAPELGMGIGRFATRRLDGCKIEVPPGCPQNDPMCIMPPVGCVEPNGPNGDPGPGKVYVGDGLDESSYTPRIAIALRVAVPLFKYVWLDGLASVTVSPGSHADPYAPTREPVTMVPPPEVALPGEPGTALQLGIGLRLGAP